MRGKPARPHGKSGHEPRFKFWFESGNEMKSVPRVMVTGHAGYIGVLMVRALVDAGYDVVGLDSMLFDGCDFGPYECAIPQLRKDVRDVTLEDLRGVDAIVHLAALCNDPLGDLN